MLKSSLNDGSSSRTPAEVPHGLAASQPLAADLFSDYGSEDTALPGANQLHMSAAEANSWGPFASEATPESAVNGASIISTSCFPILSINYAVLLEWSVQMDVTIRSLAVSSNTMLSTNDRP